MAKQRRTVKPVAQQINTISDAEAVLQRNLADSGISDFVYTDSLNKLFKLKGWDKQASRNFATMTTEECAKEAREVVAPVLGRLFGVTVVDDDFDQAIRACTT